MLECSQLKLLKLIAENNQCQTLICIFFMDLSALIRFFYLDDTRIYFVFCCIEKKSAFRFPRKLNKDRSLGPNKNKMMATSISPGLEVIQSWTPIFSFTNPNTSLRVKATYLEASRNGL